MRALLTISVQTRSTRRVLSTSRIRSSRDTRLKVLHTVQMLLPLLRERTPPSLPQSRLRAILAPTTLPLASPKGRVD